MILKYLLVNLVVLIEVYSAAATFAASQNKDSHLPDLSNATLDELTSGLRRNDFTSVDLVQAYLARIREVNDEIKAVTELNPDALEIAAGLDAERAKGNASGLLHGIPILLKGNMATMDKLNTTSGSYALLGAKVPRDSTVAAKVRSAGAIILGKANMSQWAAWRGNGSNGWSAYGGQCQGVYYPNQDPSGSSSGSAVGSAIGLAFAALGTETDGSLILPGQASSVVAIKPTVGLTSRSLVVPVSQHQDTVGSLARTVRDAATILQTIAGRDPGDNYTSAQPARIPNYIKACNLSSLSGARIGVPRNLINKDPNLMNNGQDAVFALFNAAIASLRAAGATVVDNLTVTDAALAYLTQNTSVSVINADFAVDLPKSYLSKLTSNPNNINSVSDLRNFTQTFPQEDYTNFPTVNTIHWDQTVAQGFDNTSPKFWPLYQQNLDIGGRQSILGLLSNYSLDALIAPTTSAFGLTALIGTPVINVPMGFDNDTAEGMLATPSSSTETSATVSAPTTAPTVAGGSNQGGIINPVGISFIGAKWSEEKLIGYAYAYEQRTKVREKGPQPYLLPKTQLADIITGARNASSNASSIASSNMALGGARR